MTESSAGVVVVGAGLGAARLAESLRTHGYAGPITVIGAEAHPPYDRPPLSKSVLLGKDERVDLKPDDFYTSATITLRLGQRVVSVSPGQKTVTVEHTDDPSRVETVAYDHLVLATGLRPRQLPNLPAGTTGVHVLRTFDDAVAVRAEIDAARVAVVIGAGFIGCEVAASLRSRGLDVTLVEPAPTPLAAALGTGIGALVTRMHEAHGVHVRTGVGVSDIRVGDDGAVSGVRLDDGTDLPADLVVVGIGSVPVVDYLDGSGIELAAREAGGGIACDSTGHTSADDVYALGDVANWTGAEEAGAGGTPRRVEHWNHTVEQAAIVAGQIAGADPVTASVPYFWSDQFDLKIQLIGDPRPDDDVHIVDDDGTKFLAYYSRDGVLTAVIGAGKAGAVMKSRAKVQARTPISDLV